MIAMKQIWVLHQNGKKSFQKLKIKRVNQYQNQSTCSIYHQNYLLPYKQKKNLNLVQSQHASQIYQELNKEQNSCSQIWKEFKKKHNWNSFQTKATKF
jgi:hypothetical protein